MFSSICVCDFYSTSCTFQCITLLFLALSCEYDFMLYISLFVQYSYIELNCIESNHVNFVVVRIYSIVGVIVLCRGGSCFNLASRLSTLKVEPLVA